MTSLRVRKPQNLKAAFAGESQANRRYLYFAQKADVEGYNDVAAVFRSTAEGETGHAHGHLEYLEETVTRRQASLSVAPPITSKPPLPARRTNIPTCTPVWRVWPVTKGSTKSLIGSKPWQRLKRATLVASRKLWIRSTRKKIWCANTHHIVAKPSASPCGVALPPSPKQRNTDPSNEKAV